MKRIIFISFLFSIQLTYGQDFDREKQTNEILSLILEQDSVSNKLYPFPARITAYEFDGDYSIERIFPQAFVKDSTGKQTRSLICVSPIKYENSIWDVLKKLGSNSDSLYYQEQIQAIDAKPWSEQNLSFNRKIKFVKLMWIKLHGEINHISPPIFSEDGKIAFLEFFSLKRNSQLKKPFKILIFKKDESQWKLIETIDSLNFNR